MRIGLITRLQIISKLQSSSHLIQLYRRFLAIIRQVRALKTMSFLIKEVSSISFLRSLQQQSSLDALENAYCIVCLVLFCTGPSSSSTTMLQTHSRYPRALLIISVKYTGCSRLQDRYLQYQTQLLLFLSISPSLGAQECPQVSLACKVLLYQLDSDLETGVEGTKREEAAEALSEATDAAKTVFRRALGGIVYVY